MSLSLVKKCPESNWDIFANERGLFVAVPNEQAEKIGCKSSHYGDRVHLLRLMEFGHQNFDGFTEKGLEIMEGLYSWIRFQQGKPVNFGLDFHRGEKL
jgi:hypothetical protein